MSLVLIGGGARSGKSAFALTRAMELGKKRAFIATAQAFDDEMRSRIEAHIEERGSEFTTIEEPFHLERALAQSARFDVVVVDCLTLWLSNLLLRGDGPSAILARVEAIAAALAARATHTLIITNEVGMGIVPDNALARAFRDLAGRAHQPLAAVADEIYMAMLGTLVRLRPAPLALVESSARASGRR